MKKILKIGVPVILLGCLAAFIVCFLNINRKYPNPTEKYYHTGETLTYDGFEITMTDSQLVSWQEMTDMFPNAEFEAPEGTDETKNLEDYKILFADFKIKSTRSDSASLPLIYMVAETDTWRNGIPADIFWEANSETENASLQPQLSAGEELSVKLPFLLYKSQFSAEDWKNTEHLDYDVLFDLYPKKIMFKLELE